MFVEIYCQCVEIIRVCFIAGTPLKYMKEHLIGKAAGTSMIMQTVIFGVTIILVGTAHTNSKLHFILMSQGAGSLGPSQKPFTVKFTTPNGRGTRDVEQPEAVALYFDQANLIDNHNQKSFGVLNVNSQKTKSGHTKIAMAAIIRSCIDTRMAVRARASPGSPFLRMNVLQFAEFLSKHLIHNKLNKFGFSQVKYPKEAISPPSLEPGIFWTHAKAD